MDWILSRMRLLDMEEEQEADQCVYFKNVHSYADCELVIDNFKRGAICIYSLDPMTNADAQGMMNYICGGLYAWDGDVTKVGENIFMTIYREEEA